MKTRMKIFASALLTLAVLIAFTVASAAESAYGKATDGNTEIELAYIDMEALGSGATLASGTAAPSLNEGNFAAWIDRVDLTGAQYAAELYDWLVENSDGDGTDDALIDPTEGELVGEQYVYKINITAHVDTYPSDEVYENMNAVAVYVNAAYDAFDRDHPEVFWLGGTRRITSSLSGGASGYTQYFYMVLQADKEDDTEDFDIRATDAYASEADIRSAIAERDEALEEIIGGMTATDAEGKIRYFNNWLTMNNCYNSGDLNNLAHDARECMGALLCKTGAEAPVCEAYARAFKVLCDRVGIACVLENGPAFSTLEAYNTYISTGSGGELHMWNLVKVSGLWFGVDVTWNDPTVSGVTDKISGYENEKYLLVGAETKVGWLGFSKSHFMTNIASQDGVAFTNGPVMSSEKFVSGYVCPHDFSSENIICSLCGEKACFEVSDESGTAYYISAEEAFGDGRISASAEASGVTLKLLADAASAKTPIMITTSAKFTFDLNGKTLYGVLKVAVGGDVILKDSAGGGCVSGAGNTQAILVSGGKLSLYCEVNGLLFVQGSLELGANAAVGSAGLTVGEGNEAVFTVSGAPAEKIIIIKDSTGAFAAPAEGIVLNKDWFAANESGKIIVLAENGSELAIKLALPAFTLSATEAVYDGKAHKPSAMLAGLTENIDYTVSYTRGEGETANFVSAGAITVTVTGKGDYFGEAKKTFTISKAELTAENFEIILEDNVYNGEEKRLDILADINGTGVARYKLKGAYSAPVSAGVYEVYMTVDESENHLAAINLYIGTFEILAREITVRAGEASVVQNGKPEGLSFTVGGTGLAEGNRAEVSFAEVSTAELGEKAILIEKVTVKNAIGADVTENYKITLEPGKITVLAHEHQWSYEANGADINAFCHGDGPCTENGQSSIKINAPSSTVYDGQAHAAFLSGTLHGVEAELLSIAYTDINGNSVKEPKNVGTYIACIALGGLTAKVEYKIEYLEADEEASYVAEGGDFVKAPEGYTISLKLEGENTVWSDSVEIDASESAVTYYLRNSAGQITGEKTLAIARGGTSKTVLIIAAAAGVAAVASVVTVIIVKRKNMYW